jgi:energy-coupling factor transporter transmembrane protein EcfT
MEFRKINLDEAKDTGLAIILILLIIEYVKRPGWLTLCTMAVLVLTMTYPAALKPLGRIWFGFSHILGTIVSKIILSLVFFLIVTPIGLVRRISGADPMRNKLWKKGDDSVLVKRNHRYSSDDLQKPY